MGHTLAGLLCRVVFLYVEDSIPLHSLHVCLVDLSILHVAAKYMVSGDLYICPVDLVASLCAQHRTDWLLEWLSCQIMDAFHESCIEYLGYCLAIVRLDLVGYLKGRMGYNLVFCKLFGTQS